MPGTTSPTTFTTNERLNAQPVHLYTFARGTSLWRYTDQPADVTVGGVTYRAAAISHSPIERDDETAGGECEVTCAAVTPVVPALDALGLNGLPVICTIRQTHTVGVGGVSSATVAVRFKGPVQTRTISGAECRFRLASMAAAFDRPILRWIAAPTCQHTFGDTGCGVDTSAYTTTGCAISVLSGLTLTIASAALQADGYYTAGWLTVETGPAAGERVFIRSHTGSSIVALTALPPGLTPAHTVALTAGCDRLEATCRTKFSNLDYFAGFPRVPQVNPFVRAE